MDKETLNLGIGLIILMAVNIILGSLSALFVQAFDWRRFIRGAVKAVIVIGCFAATYLVGYLNPDIIVVSIGGVDANITTAIRIIVFAGYYPYAKQVIDKLKAMVNGDLFVEAREPPKVVEKKEKVKKPAE